MNRDSAGFTLLEAMISLLLLALVGGSAVVFFGDLFADNNRVDERHHAAICLESVGDVLRHRASSNLSANLDATGIIDGLSYQVEDLGYLSHRVGPEFLNLKRLRIDLEFTATQADKSVETRTLTTEILIGQ